MSLPPALPRRFFELFTRHSPDTSGFTELHGVVASVKVPKGGSEIGTVCELLRLLPLDGATIIGHAAFTRASVARQIVKGGGDYYLTVKDNHRHLRCDLAMLFHPASPWRRQPGQTVERARSQDRGHGREET